MPDPVMQRPASPAIENALRTGGTGVVLSAIAYGLCQAFVLPVMHAWFSVDTVSPWVIPTLDLLIPGTVFGLVLGGVAWVGTNSRDIVFHAQEALKRALDPSTPEKVEDVVIPSTAVQIIAKIAA